MDNIASASGSNLGPFSSAPSFGTSAGMAGNPFDDLGMYGQSSEYRGLNPCRHDSDNDSCDTFYASPPPSPPYEDMLDESDSAQNYGPDVDVMTVDEAEPLPALPGDDEFAPPSIDEHLIDGLDKDGMPIIFLDGVTSLKNEQSRTLSKAIDGLLPLIFLSTIRASPMGTKILGFVPRSADAIGRFIYKLEKKHAYHRALHSITNAICLRYSTRPSVLTCHFQPSTSLLGDLSWIKGGIMCHYPCRLLGSRINPLTRTPPSSS